MSNETLFKCVVDVALPAAVCVTVRLTYRRHIDDVESNRFETVGVNIPKDKIRLGYSDKTGPEVAVRTYDPKRLAIVATREFMWRMCISTQDGCDIGLVF
jgi:hypothetical protein